MFWCWRRRLRCRGVKECLMCCSGIGREGLGALGSLPSARLRKVNSFPLTFVFQSSSGTKKKTISFKVSPPLEVKYFQPKYEFRRFIFCGSPSQKANIWPLFVFPPSQPLYNHHYHQQRHNHHNNNHHHRHWNILHSFFALSQPLLSISLFFSFPSWAWFLFSVYTTVHNSTQQYTNTISFLSTHTHNPSGKYEETSTVLYLCLSHNPSTTKNQTSLKIKVKLSDPPSFSAKVLCLCSSHTTFFCQLLFYLSTNWFIFPLLYICFPLPHKNISRVGEPIQATQAGQIQLFLEGDGGWVGGGKYHPFVFHISYVPVCCSCDNLQPLRVDSTLI